jgi:hypothetical protein
MMKAAAADATITSGATITTITNYWQIECDRENAIREASGQVLLEQAECTTFEGGKHSKEIKKSSSTFIIIFDIYYISSIAYCFPPTSTTTTSRYESSCY